MTSARFSQHGLRNVAGIACVLAIALWAALAPAQTNQEIIQSAQWSTYQVGEGVVLKTCHFPSLFGGQQDVYVADANMNTPGVSLKFVGIGDGTRRTVSTWVSDVTNAAAAINGAWFNPTTGVPDQFLRIGGVNLATTNPVAQERGGIVINSSGQVSCQTTPGGGWASLTDPNVMASEVPSVVNGQAYQWTPSGAPDYDYYYTTRAPRTAIGVTADNHVLLVVVDGRRAPLAAGVSYAHVAELMIALGAQNATELDGGGSSTMWGRYYGVANHPSDGSPRSVATALCIVAPAVTKPYNAEFVSAAYNGTMIEGTQQSVTLQFRNTGTTAWDASLTRLGTSEPRDRSSAFASASWIGASRPCAAPSSVAPGATASFTFTLTAPAVASAQTYYESFGLVQEGVEWFGLDQNRLILNVLPEESAGNMTIIIESRSGGQNFTWYSEAGGWSDSGANCTAAGVTSGIGMRYGSTYRSVAGAKQAKFTPVLAAEKEFDVYVTWGAGSNRRAGITYRVVHADGEFVTQIDQSATANAWVSLGTFRFAAGSGGYVEMTNEAVDLSGSMYAAAVKLEPVAGTWINCWHLY